jgi:general nucleoside transport system permease protein
MTAAATARPASRGRRWVNVAFVPVVSILLALVVAGIVIAVSGIATDTGFSLTLPIAAYESMLQGATGIDLLIVKNGQITGISNNIFDLQRSINALSTTIADAAPLILTGLSVGVGFKAGLFNIGATGQLLMGGFTAAVVGASLSSAPPLVAMTAATLAGGAAGFGYGFIPGALKAFTGAHEVVVTIMLNAIAVAIISGLVNDILKVVGPSFAQTADIGNAKFPILAGRDLHAGVLIAFLFVPLTWWFLWRTTIGFEIRTVGANPSAARYAGMNPRLLTVLTMSLCGMLAGLAGVLEIIGRVGHYPAIFGTSLGFDGITVALLGRAHPLGILLAALLLGGMRAGAALMQIQAHVPVEIIDVIQAVILIFLAADYLIRKFFGRRAARGGVSDVSELQTVTQSYGEQAAR